MRSKTISTHPPDSQAGMWIASAILLTAALGVSALLAVRKWEARRYVRGTLAHGTACESPLRALLVVPCKGTDVGLEENLQALFEQRGVEFALRFVVEEAGDAAVEPIVALQGEYPQVRSELIYAGRAIGSGQKVHNLLAATRDLPADVVVVAFADSDARPHPHWLAALLTRMNDPNIGARTGYRWLIPQRLTWPNLLLYSLNSSVAGLYCRRRLNLVWGGAWAIRRDVFEQSGIREAWVGTLSDDMVATRALQVSGLKIEFEPRCMTASPIDMTAGEMMNFLRRQFLIVRCYTPAYWWLALLGGTLLQGALWGSAVLTGILAAQGLSWWWPAAAGAVLYLLAAYRGWLGQSAIRGAMSAHESQLAWPRRFDIWLGPLAGALGWLAIVSSLVGNSMSWRGIRYVISPGGRILLLGRVIERMPLAASNELGCAGEHRRLRVFGVEDEAESHPGQQRKAA